MIRWIVYSLCLHALISLLLQFLPPLETLHKNQRSDDVVIDLIERPQEPEQQLVRQTVPPEQQKISENKPARFKSAEDQRVLQETKARRIGLTRNGFSLPENSWLKKVNPQVNNEDGDLVKPAPPRIPRAFEDAPSSVGEVLPDDVSFGEFTALNTDRFKYYSFYARVEELVRFRWEENLKLAVDRFDHRYIKNVIASKEWVTSIEFVLSEKGEFQRAIIFKESGQRAFDLSAVEAFRSARIFPNPPKGLLDPDGTIRLKYTFNVRWNPALMAGRE